MSALTATVVAPRRRSPRWPVLGLLAMIVLLAALWVYQQVGQFAGPPVSVVIDGQEVFQGWDLAQWAPMDKALVACAVVLGLLVALAVMLVAVPMILLLVVGIVLFALLGAFGLPLLMVGGVALLVLSPLLVLGLLAWWLIRALFA